MKEMELLNKNELVYKDEWVLIEFYIVFDR